MSRFQQNLATLPGAEGIAQLLLLDQAGATVAVIENKPGSQGSLRIYYFLAQKHGAINSAAAREGLVLYAEHVDDARRHPGQHPNIDRLFKLIAEGEALLVQIKQA